MIKSILKLIVGITLVITVIVVGPLLGIWSLNTLFPVLEIQYTWQTWAAFLLLFGSATGLKFGSRKKND
jgi:TctA family transporter